MKTSWIVGVAFLYFSALMNQIHETNAMDRPNQNPENNFCLVTRGNYMDSAIRAMERLPNFQFHEEINLFPDRQTSLAANEFTRQASEYAFDIILRSQPYLVSHETAGIMLGMLHVLILRSNLYRQMLYYAMNRPNTSRPVANILFENRYQLANIDFEAAENVNHENDENRRLTAQRRRIRTLTEEQIMGAEPQISIDAHGRTEGAMRYINLPVISLNTEFRQHYQYMNLIAHEQAHSFLLVDDPDEPANPVHEPARQVPFGNHPDPPIDTLGVPEIVARAIISEMSGFIANRFEFYASVERSEFVTSLEQTLLESAYTENHQILNDIAGLACSVTFNLDVDSNLEDEELDDLVFNEDSDERPYAQMTIDAIPQAAARGITVANAVRVITYPWFSNMMIAYRSLIYPLHELFDLQPDLAFLNDFNNRAILWATDRFPNANNHHSRPVRSVISFQSLTVPTPFSSMLQRLITTAKLLSKPGPVSYKNVNDYYLSLSYDKVKMLNHILEFEDGWYVVPIVAPKYVCLQYITDGIQPRMTDKVLNRALYDYGVLFINVKFSFAVHYILGVQDDRDDADDANIQYRMIDCDDFNGHSIGNDLDNINAECSIGDFLCRCQYRATKNGNKYLPPVQTDMCDISCKPGNQVVRINQNAYSTGDWDKKYEIKFPFVLNGTTFTYAYSMETRSWIIQKLRSHGRLGRRTDEGHWSNPYDTQAVVNVGERVFVYGQNIETYYWFLQEILPGGKMATVETDNGFFNNPYKVVVPVYVNRKTYLFGHNVESYYWFIQEVLPGGKIANHETDNGNFHSAYKMIIPFTINQRTFLYRQNLDTKFWFTQEILSGGKLSPRENDFGTAEIKYDLQFITTVRGRTYLFSRDDRTKWWYTGELLANGKMEPKIRTGDSVSIAFPYTVKNKNFFFLQNYNTKKWFIFRLLSVLNR